jgi:cytochrome bd-type quinol oxidase subunit 2
MIKFGEILRGAARRFFPGAVVGAIASGLAFGPLDYVASMWTRLIGGSLVAAGLATIGFVAAMALTSRRLRVDADVAGRKSAVAGFVAAGTAFSILAFTSSFVVMTVSMFRLSPFHLGQMIAIPIVAGAVATLGVYFPWLSRTPEQIADPAQSHTELMSGASRFMLRRHSRSERRQ